MGDDILSALLSAIVALLVAWPLGGLLKKHPAPFYGVAAVLVGAHLYYRFAGMYVPWLQTFVDMMNKGYLACSFLAIVMFIGVLDEGSPARRRLQPIRAELSIISFVLAMSHAIAYLASYLPRLGMIFFSNTLMATSIVVAGLLTAVYIVLSATSLHALRVRIPYRTWKAIQRMSYAMVALLYVHILLALGRTAFLAHSSSAAQFALSVYTVLIVIYAILRVLKARRDRVRHQAAAAPYAAEVAAHDA